jgi:hypothetical protein
MKVKIFEDNNYNQLETKVNSWLSENPCVEIKFATQTISRICLFYENEGYGSKKT